MSVITVADEIVDDWVDRLKKLTEERQRFLLEEIVEEILREEIPQDQQDELRNAIIGAQVRVGNLPKDLETEVKECLPGF